LMIESGDKYYLVRVRVIPVVLSVALLVATGCQSVQPQPKYETEGPASITPQMTQEDDSQTIVSGEIIYVPAYSSVFHEIPKPYPLTTTLNVHNIDPDNSIQLTRVEYYSTTGELIKDYLEADMEIYPFQTMQFVVEEEGTDGVTGANFIVEWVAEKQVNSPIVEALMISTKTQQGISFLTSGRVIKNLGNNG